MHNHWTRRKFLSSAGALTLASPFAKALDASASASPLQGRYLTHISLVRVNQIEVTRTHNIGEDEAPDNSPDHIRSRREAFARGCPDGRMTWAISWLALNHDRKQYQEARRLSASYHARYGDEIPFIPGGYFAPMYNPREETRQTIHKALQLVSKMVGSNY